MSRRAQVLREGQRQTAGDDHRVPRRRGGRTAADRARLRGEAAPGLLPRPVRLRVSARSFLDPLKIFITLGEQ